MTSVNTNASATTALRTLQQTNKALETTQNRISTGLKIGEAKDNAAYWAISTTLKSDNKSLSTVKDALGLGAATVDVAYQGLNKTKDVLDEIQKKLTAATAAGVDKNVIQSEISELQKQLVSIAASSTFSGENWLSIDSSVANYNSNKEVVSSFARDANNAISIGTIGIDISKVALFDGNSDVTKSGLIDAEVGLKDSSGRDLSFGGTAQTGNTAAGGIEATAKAGTDAVKAKAVFTGSFVAATIDANDTLTMSFKADNASVASNVVLNAADVTGSGFATQGRIGSVAELATAVNNALARNSISNVTAVVDGGNFALQRMDGGVNKTVEVTAWTGADVGFTQNVRAAASAGGTGTAAIAEVQRFVVGGTPAVGSGSFTVNGVSIPVNTTATTTDATATVIRAAIQAKITDGTLTGISVGGTASDIDITYSPAGAITPTMSFTANTTGVTGAWAEQTAGADAIKASGIATLSATNTTLLDADDAVQFKFTDSVAGVKTINVTMADLNNAGHAGGAIDSNTKFFDALKVAAIRQGLDSAYDFTFNGSTAITVSSKTVSAGQTIAVTALTGAASETVDTDTAAENQFGLAAPIGVKRGTDAIAATSTSATAFPGTGITLDADDKIYFDVKAGGATGATTVAIDKALVNSTLATASKAKVVMGAFDAFGLVGPDTVGVSIEWNGVSSTYSVTGLTAGSSAEQFAAALNASSDAGSVAFTTKGNVSVENGRLVITAKDAGSTQSVKVANVTNSNAFAGSGGLQQSAVARGTDAIADAGGKISNAREMALITNAALSKAGVTGVVADSLGSNLTLSTSGTGVASKLEVTKLQASAGAAKMSIDKIDISSTGLDTVNAKSADEIKQTLSAYISVVKAAITKVTTAAATLGAAASRIDLQNTFVDTLMDTIDKGVGNLIDADLSEESTRLQALQTKQQLGVQALSIANSGTQQILRLFQ